MGPTYRKPQAATGQESYTQPKINRVSTLMGESHFRGFFFFKVAFKIVLTWAEFSSYSWHKVQGSLRSIIPCGFKNKTELEMGSHVLVCTEGAGPHTPVNSRPSAEGIGELGGRGSLC